LCGKEVLEGFKPQESDAATNDDHRPVDRPKTVLLCDHLGQIDEWMWFV